MVFADPAILDPHCGNAADRPAFGLGSPFCLGASLGKLETRLAVEHLAKLPRLRPVAGQSLSFRPNISFRRPRQLRVRQG
jgi:cytochrome P450